MKSGRRRAKAVIGGGRSQREKDFGLSRLISPTSGADGHGFTSDPGQGSRMNAGARLRTSVSPIAMLLIMCADVPARLMSRIRRRMSSSTVQGFFSDSQNTVSCPAG